MDLFRGGADNRGCPHGKLLPQTAPPKQGGVYTHRSHANSRKGAISSSKGKENFVEAILKSKSWGDTTPPKKFRVPGKANLTLKYCKQR